MEEFLTILQSLESEKSRLIECNKTFSERLANDRKRVADLSETISKQKIQIARLESKIAELQKELDKKEGKKKRSQRIADYSNNLNGRLASIVIENSNSQTSISQTSLISASSVNLQYEDLENRIQLANEKNSLLEDELNLLSKEKENDFKAFNDVISNSKNIVLSMIIKAKENEAKQRPLTDNSTQTVVYAEDDDIESGPDM